MNQEKSFNATYLAAYDRIRLAGQRIKLSVLFSAFSFAIPLYQCLLIFSISIFVEKIKKYSYFYFISHINVEGDI